MNYVIRKKEKRDCYGVANMVVKAWNETYRGLISDDYLDSLSVQKIYQHNYEDFNEKDNHQFVLEVNNEIVGFVNVGSSEEKDYDNCGEIHALYIIKDYQKNGYGKLLIEAGIKELKNMGFDKMLIGCLVGNPTNTFYEHIGGKFVKTRIFEKLNLPENVYYFEI